MTSLPTNPPPHRVLLLGRAAAAEMRALRDSVFAAFADGEIRAVSSPASIEHFLSNDWKPALVVVCQSHPDEFTPKQVQELIRRFPLARWICAAGLWCESDGRNRNAWPIGVRVPARIAHRRVAIERAVLDGARSPLPLTAGREEAFEYDAVSSALPPSRAGTATVISTDRELRRRFEDDLRIAGYRACDIARSDSPHLILWDADPWNDDRLAELRELRCNHSNARIVALSNFAPPEDEHRLQTAGADFVLCKLETNLPRLAR